MPDETTFEAPGELITVVQLPIIKDRLVSMKEAVKQRVGLALSLACTEETVQTVKAERADLNKLFAGLEEQRKAVKAAVMGPYNEFEAIYRECVSNVFKSADTVLKGKIDDIEAEQKHRCEEGLREYFAELCAVHHLDWLTYERTGIKIDMASAKSKTPNKLRKQLAEFVARVNDDVNRIDGMEGSEEMMLEFRRTLDAAQAIQTVLERRRRVEEERTEKEARKAVQAQEAEMVRRVEALAPPTPVQQPKTFQCVFTVHTTMDKLKKLKQFLEMEGIQYE